MATVTITLTDIKSKDGRRGIEIKRNNHDPVLMMDGEPAPTAAQMCGIILVESARKFADGIQMTVEEKR